MTSIIDRRLNSRDKNINNRKKFINRSRAQIKKAVRDSIDSGNIADIEKDTIRVKTKGVSEPNFQVDGRTGDKKYVLPGNEHYSVGDKERKPPGGAGGGSGGQEGGDGDPGEDDFEFVLNSDEYLDFIFEDLELPRLAKKSIKDVTKTKPKRSGFTNAGNPAQIDIVRSMKNSQARRIGLGRPSDDAILELEDQLETAERTNNYALAAELRKAIDEAGQRQKLIPWMDPFDIRYRNFTQVPQPISAAVMFCVMDVSASMGQEEKELAKRFFFLLHMFLARKYEKVDLIFIRHHTQAKEVDEDEFFNGRENGGTMVSSATDLVQEIIKERYNIDEWNVYVAQASDGDNFPNDRDNLQRSMEDLLPITQYFAYVEIKNEYNQGKMSDVWKQYYHFEREFAELNMRVVVDKTDIWKVFRELFSKENTV